MDEVDPILERKQRDRYNVLMGFVKSADLRFFSTMLFSDYHKKYGKDDVICNTLIEFLEHKIKCDQLYYELNAMYVTLSQDKELMESYEETKRMNELLEFLVKPKEEEKEDYYGG